MTYVRLFSVLVVYASVYSSSADNLECGGKTLSVCKLPLGDGSSPAFPKQGPRGETGDTGLKGEQGEKGELGDSGRQGNDGMQGVQGLKGDTHLGETGDGGVNGLKGIRGDQGGVGPVGPKGTKGHKGIKGMRGAVGPPGPDGVAGSCPCLPSKESSGVRRGPVPKPKKEDKHDKLCKDLTIEKTGYHDIEISNIRLKVQCVVRGKETTKTCLPRNDGSNPKTYSFKNISKGFWLSSKNFTLKELYGIDRKILTHIQKKSNSAYQTIKYHCYNSIPFPRDYPEKSLLLLSWNDNTIGPLPTLTKPYFYSIENDGCSSNETDTWNSTDIKLVSVYPRRVPITDFFIRDVGSEIPQQFKIEHVELCFD